MAKIVIRDLDMSQELDKLAMTKIIGGRASAKGKRSGAWKAPKHALLSKSMKMNRLI